MYSRSRSFMDAVHTPEMLVHFETTWCYPRRVTEIIVLLSHSAWITSVATQLRIGNNHMYI
jgi:hypothetical protein